MRLEFIGFIGCTGRYSKDPWWTTIGTHNSFASVVVRGRMHAYTRPLVPGHF